MGLARSQRTGLCGSHAATGGTVSSCLQHVEQTSRVFCVGGQRHVFPTRTLGPCLRAEAETSGRPLLGQNRSIWGSDLFTPAQVGSQVVPAYLSNKSNCETHHGVEFSPNTKTRCPKTFWAICQLVSGSMTFEDAPRSCSLCPGGCWAPPASPPPGMSVLW